MVLSRIRVKRLAFSKELRQRLDSVSFDRLSMSSSEQELETALEKTRQAEMVVCAIFARVVTGTGTVGLPERLGRWVEKLSQIERPVVTIALGTPYVIQGFPALPTYFCTFSNVDVSQTAAVKALFGEIPVKGKLPVTLPGVAVLHSGMERERRAMILRSPAPAESASLHGGLKGFSTRSSKSRLASALSGAGGHRTSRQPGFSEGYESWTIRRKRPSEQRDNL
jgi:beta-N-acetylhexosaminidase